MHTTMLDVPTPSGTADAFLARPDEGTHPGVLLCMDAFGLRRRIFEMAERIASHGYVVLAPNLFHRFGRAPLVDVPDPMTPEARAAAISAVLPMLASMTPDVAMPEAAAYLDALEADPHRAGPVGVVGYCMGGTFAMQVAGRLPDRVAAVATFHAGHLVMPDPDSPHRQVDAITAELYLGHAEDDPSIPAEDIAALEAALDAAGATYTSEVHRGAAHGFTMADTPSHHPEAEARHWDRLLDLFDRRLHGTVEAPGR